VPESTVTWGSGAATDALGHQLPRAGRQEDGSVGADFLGARPAAGGKLA